MFHNRQSRFSKACFEGVYNLSNQAVKMPSGEIAFESMLKGSPDQKYIFGVDPASEVDNFSIVSRGEGDHRCIVHCWTTNRQQHKDKLKSKIVDEDDFYSYCAKKNEELMKAFPCVEIALDAQGGGIAVMEALHDKDKIPDGEVPI